MVTEVYEAYQKALEAWRAIPKEMFKREYFGKHGEETCRLSCPTCGVVFAEFQVLNNFAFNEAIFCCGKLIR